MEKGDLYTSIASDDNGRHESFTRPWKFLIIAMCLAIICLLIGVVVVSKRGDSGGGSTYGWSAGSRLKAQQSLGEDGSTYPLAFYDTLLKVTCVPLTAADGATRCIPFSSVQLNFDDGHYSDTGCTQLVAYCATTCLSSLSPPSYANVTDNELTCGAGVRVFPVGAAYFGALYYKSDTGCSSATRISTDTYYMIGAEVTPSDFVKFANGPSTEVSGD